MNLTTNTPKISMVLGRTAALFSVWIVTLWLISVPVFAGLPLAALKSSGSATIAPMLENTMPGVVNISTLTMIQTQENPLFSDPFFRHFFNLPDTPRQRQSQSLGSGVIIDANQGFVVTNNHVIDKADEIRVTLRDGRSFDAKVIGKDPEADLAVLQIKAEKLNALHFADSDKARVGDFVVAIGNPFGLGQTVTSGIISALGRSGLGIEGYEDFIQTDASINPGNSGGALVNFNGELLGINTAIIGPSGGNVGIGFAIPSNMAKDIIDQLISHGEVKRGQLGVLVQQLTEELARAFDIPFGNGVVVSQVIPDTPAAKAGVKQGDVIISINGVKVKTPAQLRNAIGLQRVGKKFRLSLLRNGKKKRFNITIKETTDKLATKSQSMGQPLSDRLSGAFVAEIGSNHPMYGATSGIEIVKVERNSNAWRAGLRAKDIIVSVNRRSIDSVKELKQALSGKRSVLLNIRRGNGALFIVIQ